jgi:hypothetical protein
MHQGVVLRLLLVAVGCVGVVACASFEVSEEDQAGDVDGGPVSGADGGLASDIAICGRGDQDMLRDRLAGGSLLLTFRDAGGAAIGTELVEPTWPAGLPLELPADAASVEARGLDASGSQVAWGAGETLDGAACLCLALDGEFDQVCAGVACEMDGGTCAYRDADGDEPCMVIDDAANIVDESSSCFTGGGPATYLRHETVGWQSTLVWTDCTELDHAENYGQWALAFERAGRYTVEAYIEDAFGESTQAPYHVMHGSDLDKVVVNQEPAAGWTRIGEFDFDAGGAQWIFLPDNTGEPEADTIHLVFDALRFTRQ